MFSCVVRILIQSHITSRKRSGKKKINSILWAKEMAGHAARTREKFMKRFGRKT